MHLGGSSSHTTSSGKASAYASAPGFPRPSAPPLLTCFCPQWASPSVCKGLASGKWHQATRPLQEEGATWLRVLPHPPLLGGQEGSEGSRVRGCVLLPAPLFSPNSRGGRAQRLTWIRCPLLPFRVGNDLVFIHHLDILVLQLPVAGREKTTAPSGPGRVSLASVLGRAGGAGAGGRVVARGSGRT